MKLSFPSKKELSVKKAKTNLSILNCHRTEKSFFSLYDIDKSLYIKYFQLKLVRMIKRGLTRLAFGNRRCVLSKKEKVINVSSNKKSIRI